MNMKYIISALAVMLCMANVNGQLMRLVPFEKGISSGKCLPNSAKGNPQLKCYALEYTPNQSGVMTGYTTGFFISCTSKGSAVDFNASCVMKDNTRVLDGCTEGGVVLLNSSGNSGTSLNNTVTAGQPVILHQVCFTIPIGESISIREDEATDLTTTIVTSSGIAVTEYPLFTEAIVKNIRPDVGRPVAFLDFKGTPAGDFVTQLDWTATRTTDVSHYIIEKSIDGQYFTPLTTVPAVVTEGAANEFYQFIDTKAVEGKNFYRLREVMRDESATGEFSPVRVVTFGSKGFSVDASPNPATEFITVKIQSKNPQSIIQLIDGTGRVVLENKTEENIRQARLEIRNLNSGVYTLLVKSGDDTFTDKIMVVK